jgi:DNA modification methylase
MQSDARHIPLADESVHCVVTSPPYWGLRDYGMAKDKQLGLESTPEEYVANMVAVFREVRRVLRKDGTLWLNLGDSYAGSWGSYHPHSPPGKHGQRLKETSRWNRPAYSSQEFLPPTAKCKGLKPKDLCGIPWRVAFALQADGWYLRSDIIWSKPNPMPESITDRPTKAHEYLFLLAKSEKYFYDAEAIAGPVADSTIERWGNGGKRFAGQNAYFMKRDGGKHIGQLGSTGMPPNGTRNRRTVWEINTQPHRGGAHFATFPEALVQPCIAAGTSEHGCCRECGAPWGRIVSSQSSQRQTPWNGAGRKNGCPAGGGHYGRTGTWSVVSETIGWQPTCRCPPADPVPCIVFDPFAGTGTVGEVAFKMGRRFILADLKYHNLMRQRIPPMAELLLSEVENAETTPSV